MSALTDTIATRFVQAECALIVIAALNWPLSSTLRRRAQLLTATKQPQMSSETFRVLLIPGARVRGCDTLLSVRE